jgi:hypothetical protein
VNLFRKTYLSRKMDVDSMLDQETWESAVLQTLELPNGLIASNRIMRAATWMGQVEENGVIGNTIIDTYNKIRAGIVVTGFQYVMYEGQSIRRMMRTQSLLMSKV